MANLSIPGFEIQECVGKGGMASVWMARQVSLDRTVAIKVLSQSLSAEEADVQRFQFEAQAAARLKHQGIIQVYDAGVVNGLYFIVMEYVAGYTVGDWCRRKERLGQDDILLVAECVADALHYAWETEKIIHCDVKPDNIIVDADGTVKVTDLGLARTINAMGGSPEQEEILGTPNYISPEQSAGREGLDCRTDIYALGATMYQLATGRMLFQNHPPSQVMDLQITGHQPDPIDVNPDLPTELCWLIEKMLIKDRNHRSPDWAVVLEDIDRVKKGDLPTGPLTDDHTSTVARSPTRTGRKSESPPKISHKAAARVRSQVAAQQKSEPRPLFWGGLLLVLILAVAAITVIRESHTMRPAGGTPVVQPKTPPATPTPAAPPVVRNPARESYNQAVAWATEHPAQHDEAIKRFQSIAREYPGTPVAQEAASAAERAIHEREDQIVWALEKLDSEALEFVNQSDYDAAVEVFTSYDGPFVDATREARKQKSDEIRRIAAIAAEAPPPVEEEPLPDRFDGRLRDLARAMTDADWPRVQEVAREMRWDPQLADHRKTVRNLLDLIHNAASVNRDILRSFEAQSGQSISIDLKSGRVDATIQGLERGYIETDAGRFAVEDLAATEIFRRLVQTTSPAASLRKGIAALDARSYTYAKRFFRKVGEPLATALVDRVEEMEGER